MQTTKIGVIVGSLRRGSYSRSIANAIVGFLPERFEAHMLDIGQLPLFNQDYDDDGATPPEWTAFRGQVKAMDGFLFVTPEYNRSYPPAIKNALDIASRPFGSNVWAGKPGAIVSVSPGKTGGFGSNHHLRQPMTFLNIYMMQQPEAYIGSAAEILDEQGKVNNERSNSFLNKFADAYVQWVDKFVS